MPLGGPNEGFASNYGYGGMPGTTTGMAQGGYAATGNPGIGAQARYQQGALNALDRRYGQGPTRRTPGSATPVTPEFIAAQRIIRGIPEEEEVAPTATPVPAKPVPPNYSKYRAPFNPSMDQEPAWESAFPNGNFIAPTPHEWFSPRPGSGLGFGGTGNWNNANSTHIGRQFGGPVAPGQQYTVGENGPETLQMGPGGGGQVIPNNLADRLGGMNPQTLQALFQMIQQQRQPQMNPGQAPVGQPAPQMPQRPQPPQMPQRPQPPQTQPPMSQGSRAGGSFQLGDWRNRMGIEGLSRPPQSMGFGGSGLGIPGVMGQMRNRMG